MNLTCHTAKGFEQLHKGFKQLHRCLTLVQVKIIEYILKRQS
jgi:hypothetical protein